MQEGCNYSIANVTDPLGGSAPVPTYASIMWQETIGGKMIEGPVILDLRQNYLDEKAF